MKKKVKESPVKLIITILLWGFGVFFLLGSLVYIGKSILAAIFMFLLAIILIPASWRKIYSYRPQQLGRSTRIISALILFFIAVAVTPQEAKSQTQANVEPVKPVASKVVNKKEDLVGIYPDNGGYLLRATGVANTDYSIRFSNDTTVDTKTNGNGELSIKVPEDAGVFGRVVLSRDINGFWFGGDKTYDEGFFSFQGKKIIYQDHSLTPILLGVGSAPSYEVSGYYLPNATLIVKTGDKVLAETKVDRTGRFKFASLPLATNFTPITVYERISIGWFSSKDTVLIKDQFLDFNAHKVLVELPVYTKEESSTATVPFSSQNVDDNSLAKGETKVTQEGVDGQKTTNYIVTYKGNDEIQRVEKSETVTKQPVTKITSVGTYVAPAYTAPSSSAVIDCPNGTYVNSAGNTVCSPYASSSVPSGATAKCGDGTYSFSQSRSGTCSHHGGVAIWY